MHNMCNSHRSL